MYEDGSNCLQIKKCRFSSTADEKSCFLLDEPPAQLQAAQSDDKNMLVAWEKMLPYPRPTLGIVPILVKNSSLGNIAQLLRPVIIWKKTRVRNRLRVDNNTCSKHPHDILSPYHDILIPPISQAFGPCTDILAHVPGTWHLLPLTNIGSDKVPDIAGLKELRLFGRFLH